MNWRKLFGLAPVPGNLITYRDLKRLHACESQVRRFRRVFGRKVLVTASVAREHGQRFDPYWVAINLLTDEGRVEFARFERDWTAGRVWDEQHLDWSPVRWIKLAELLVTHRKWS